MTIGRQFFILLGLSCLAAALWFAGLIGAGDRSVEAAADERQRPARPPVPVIVETARADSSAALVEAVGTGVAVRAITLFSETSGEVVDVTFTAGDRVTAGTALVRLDDENERLAVDLARVRLKEARQNLARYEQAAPSGAVSASEVDSARSEVEAARIELSRAELALSRRTVRAPFDGVLGIAGIETGQRVLTTTPIATLDDRSSLFVDFEVPEAFAASVSAGQTLTATAWSLPGETFSGSVEHLASRVDPDTRTLRVRARLPNASDRLRSGMSFVIQVPIGGENLPSVPSVSVQWNREGAYVWRIDAKDRAEQVPIEVRKRSEAWVLVGSGVREGDRIVIEGVQRLRPNRAVEIVERTAPATGGTLANGS